MMSPLSLERLVRERLDKLRHEAHVHHLSHQPGPSLRRRLALCLTALAERLEPELSQPPARRLGRNTPFVS